MPPKLIPDVMLTQYLAYKEWRLAACSDMMKKLMAFRQVSRSGLWLESYRHWQRNWYKRPLIGRRLRGNWPVVAIPRRQTRAVWFFNYSTFIPVASDLRIQFGAFRGLFTEDWTKYVFIFNEPQSELYTPWPKFIQKFLTKKYFWKEGYYTDKDWDRLRAPWYEVALDHSDGTYRCFKPDWLSKFDLDLRLKLRYNNNVFNALSTPQHDYHYYDNKELQAEWLRGGKNWKKSANKYLRELRKTNQMNTFVDTYSGSALSHIRTTYPFMLKLDKYNEKRRFAHLIHIRKLVWTWDPYTVRKWNRSGINFV